MVRSDSRIQTLDSPYVADLEFVAVLYRYRPHSRMNTKIVVTNKTTETAISRFTPLGLGNFGPLVELFGGRDGADGISTRERAIDLGLFDVH